MALGFTTSWQLVTLPEAVTLESQTAPGTFTPFTVPHAKRRAILATQEDQHGVKELVWHLWADGIEDAATPKRDDRILDGSLVRWVVYQVEVQSLAARYRCSCRRLVG